MNYYTPYNPNHALRKVPQKRPVLRVLRSVCTVLLSLLLICALVLTGLIAAVRTSITPEAVYSFVNTIEYAEFPLPMDGTFVTIADLMQETFGQIGLKLNESDIEILFEQFSIPTILAGLAQDLTGWLLHGSARPLLLPEKIASTALSGVDDSILTLLHFIGDPVDVVSQMLVTPLSTLDLEGFLDRLEPVRTLFSADTLALLTSVCLLLMVLLFLLHRCSFIAFCLPFGLSLGMASLLTLLSAVLVSVNIPVLTQVYAAYLQRFASPVFRLVCCYSVIGILSGFLCFSLWFFPRLLRHLREKNTPVS